MPDPDGVVQSWFDDFLPQSESRMILDWPAPAGKYEANNTYYPGQPYPAPNYSRPVKPKLGTWYRPTGAGRWGFGFFLADYARLQNILAVTGTNNASATLTLDTHPAAGHSRSWGGCYLLPPHPVNVDINDAGGLWVLPIVDERYYWQSTRIAFTDFDSGGISTWATFYAAIASIMGITLTADLVPSTYLAPNLFFMLGAGRGSYSQLLDAAAWSVGQRIIPAYPAYNSNTGQTAGEWYAANWTTSQARRTANLTLQYDLGAIQGGSISAFPQQSALAPAQINVVFRPWQNGVAMDSFYKVPYVKVVTAAAAGWVAGTTAADNPTIISLALANYSTGGGAPDNQATLDALAVQIATDYYNAIWVQDSAIAGVSQWQESGYDDWVEFSAGRPDDMDQMPCTRIHSAPYNLSNPIGLHYDTTTWEYGDKIYGTLDGALAANGNQTITLTGADGGIPGGTTHIKVYEVLGGTANSGDKVEALRYGDRWVVCTVVDNGTYGGTVIGAGTFAALTVAGGSNTFTYSAGLTGTATATVPYGFCVPSQTYLAANVGGTVYILNPQRTGYGQFSSAVVGSGTGTLTLYTGTLGSESSSGVTVTAEVRRGVCVTGRTYIVGYTSSGFEILNPDYNFIGQGSLTDCTGGASVTMTVYSGTQGSESSQSVTVSAYVRKGFIFASTTYNIEQKNNGFEVIDPSLNIQGKPGSDIAADSTGSMVVWTGTGAGSASSVTVSSIRNDSGCLIKASKFVAAKWFDSRAAWIFDTWHNT